MMSYFKTMSLSVALALGLMFGAGCGNSDGEPDPGNGGTKPPPPNGVAQTVEDLCQRLDDCNELVGISVSECIDLTNFCLDQNFPTQSLQEDWAKLTEDCQEFATCAVFVNCWLTEVPIC